MPETSPTARELSGPELANTAKNLLEAAFTASLNVSAVTGHRIFDFEVTQDPENGIEASFSGRSSSDKDDAEDVAVHLSIEPDGTSTGQLIGNDGAVNTESALSDVTSFIQG